jgi:hypothetical protein
LFVVYLALEYDMTYDQIAAHQGITKQGVAARFRNARRQVAEALPHLAYEGNVTRRRPPLDTAPRERAFLEAARDLQARGEYITLPAIEKLTGYGRNTTYRTYRALQARGLIRRLPQVGRNIVPYELLDCEGSDDG